MPIDDDIDDVNEDSTGYDDSTSKRRENSEHKKAEMKDH